MYTFCDIMHDDTYIIYVDNVGSQSKVDSKYIQFFYFLWISHACTDW